MHCSSYGTLVVPVALFRFWIRQNWQFLHSINVNYCCFSFVFTHCIIAIIVLPVNDIRSSQHNLPFCEFTTLFPWVVQNYFFAHFIALWFNSTVVLSFHPLHASAGVLSYKCGSFLQPFEGLQCKLISI